MNRSGNAEIALMNHGTNAEIALMNNSLSAEIRRVLRDHGRLPLDVDAIRDQDDLFQAGMTSHASVNVMLALEDTFDIEFPDEMLRRSVFESIAGIAAAVRELQAQAV